MLAADRDALICDLAESYGILEYRALPAWLLAVLASGLRENARIRQRLAAQPADTHTLLLAAVVVLAWAQTKQAQQGTGRPPSVLQALLGQPHAPGGLVAFDTAADYEAARARILKEGYDGN